MQPNSSGLQVLFLSASEEINKRPEEYWTLVMDIAKRNSLGRIKRCGTIMGRDEGEELSAAQIMYPCMQCADIFYLKVTTLHTPVAQLIAADMLSASLSPAPNPLLGEPAMHPDEKQTPLIPCCLTSPV